jgi:hypothetical protein
LTGVGVSGIVSTANATAITIDSSERVGCGTTTPPYQLSSHEPATASGTYFPMGITGGNYLTGYGVGLAFRTENTSNTQKAKCAIVGEGTGAGNNLTSLHICLNNVADTTTEVSLSDSKLEFTNDGRGISQFTAGAWVNFDGTGTPSIRDSHNVSSIGDWATGNFGIYIASGFSNTNYCPVAMGDDDRYITVCRVHTNPQGGRLDLYSTHNNGSRYDQPYNNVAIFGDMQ